jgi:pilus assembly protein CpaB
VFWLNVPVAKTPTANASDTTLNQTETIMVPTPTRSIARGEKLSEVPFTNLRWPKSRLNDNYVTNLDSYMDAIALSTLPQYLPIPIASITKERVDQNAVVEGIPEGMRAITVKVDAESAVEGWARSGNFVDIILIKTNRQGRASREQAGLESRIIAENVKILSAGQSVVGNSSSSTSAKLPSTVTLLTSQEDALKIKTASTIGKLTFALRGQGDQSPTQVMSFNHKELLGAKQTLKSEPKILGYAKGPDGKHYVLDDRTRWVRTSNDSDIAFIESHSRAKLDNIQQLEE